MKKIWPIVLLGIILLLIACSKEKVAETDLIFEGKTYVIGSNKPPKSQPKKMLIQQRENHLGNARYVTVDSFYTDKDGFFNYRFKPSLIPNNYLVIPEPRLKYDNIDLLVPLKLGLHKQDFKILSSGVLRIRIKNSNYQWGDSLVMIDPAMSFAIFSGPLVYDHTFDLFYPSFQPLLFEFKLKRNNIWRTWNEIYYLHDDSTHYHEVIY
jgi:hypothetical protein